MRLSSSRTPWTRCFAVAALVVATASVPARCAAQVSLTPVILQVPADRDTTVPLLVKNSGNADVAIRVYRADYDTDARGQHAFGDVGSIRGTCGSSITVREQSVRVPAGGQAIVSVRSTPRDSACWGIVFAEETQYANGHTVNGRIGAKVFVSPAAGRRELGIDSATASFHGDSLRIRFRARAGGNAPLSIRGTVEIHGLDGTVASLRAVEPFTLLPGRAAWNEVAFQAARSSAEQVALVILDFEGSYRAAAQVVIPSR